MDGSQVSLSSIIPAADPLPPPAIDANGSPLLFGSPEEAQAWRTQQPSQPVPTAAPLVPAVPDAQAQPQPQAPPPATDNNGAPLLFGSPEEAQAWRTQQAAQPPSAPAAVAPAAPVVAPAATTTAAPVTTAQPPEETGFFSGLASGAGAAVTEGVQTAKGEAFTAQPGAQPQPQRGWWNELGYGIGHSFPVLGAGIGGGTVGAAVGGPVGGAVGAGLSVA